MAQTVIPGQYIVPTHKVVDGRIQTYISGRGTRISEFEVEGKSVPIITGTILGRVFIQAIEAVEGGEGGVVEGAGEGEVEGPEQGTVGSMDNGKKFIVSVLPKTNTYLKYTPELRQVSNNLPKENDIVLVKITKLNQLQAFCEILTVEGSGNVIEDSGIGSNGELAHLSMGMGGGSQAMTNHSTIASSQSTNFNAMSIDLGETFKGLIRSQDVRSTERDKVKIFECFKPGDIVRAEIISLGDGSNYYLSTARNDLGVIYAKSEGGAGYSMFPVDWQHMVCPTTGVVEMRKCAKPFT